MHWAAAVELVLSERPVYDFVRYDSARQGPWGSMKLLWMQRLRQPQATLGGLLLVLSIGIDPFIQQLVGHYDCSVVVNDENTLLPRTNKINDQSRTPTFEQDIRSAYSQGITELGNGLFPDCSTGNCSFTDPYGTIGYCSSCEDTSDEITISTSRVPINVSTGNISIGVPDMDETITIISSLPKGRYWESNVYGPSQLNVTYSVNVSKSTVCAEYGEYGVEVVKMDIFDGDGDDFGTRQISPRITVKILAGKTTYSDRHIDIATGEAIEGCENGTSADGNSSDPWRCRGYGAATCTVQPCVRVYNATVEASRLLNAYLLNQENWPGLGEMEDWES